jgi:hypothetical protein
VLQDCLVCTENDKEACEAVHSYVEEVIGKDIPFSFLNDVMKSTFACSERDGR